MRLPYLATLTLAAAACSSSQTATTAPANDANHSASSTDDGGPTSRQQGAPFCPSAHWCWENPLPQGYSLASVHGTARDDVWAVGEYGTVLWYGGDAWAPVVSGTMASLRSVWAARRDDAWIAGDGGTLLHWNGSQLVPMKVTTQDIVQVSGSGPNDVWAIANAPAPDNGSTFLHWDGKSWKASPTGYMRFDTIWARSADDVWAAGNPDGMLGSVVLLHFDGSKWKSVPAPDERDFEPAGLKFTGDADATWLLAAGFNQSTISSWNGSEWETPYVSMASDQPLVDVWANDGDAWMVGPDDVVRWHGARDEKSPNAISALAIWGTANDDIWQVGENGGISHFDGQEWSAPNGARAKGQRIVMGSGPDDVWNVGAEVLHYDGTSWSEVPAPVTRSRDSLPATWASIWVNAKDDAWILDTSGRVAHWDGASWKALAEPAFLRVENGRVWASGNEDDVWVQDTGGWDSPQHWNGSKWVEVGLSGDCRSGRGTAIWGSSPTDIWITGKNGISHVTGPDIAKPGDSIERACSLDASITDAKMIWGRSSNDIWAAGAAADAIYHYDGSTWRRTSSGTTTALTSIWASGANDAWAAGTDLLNPRVTAFLHWDGKAWTPVSGMAGVSAVWGADAKNVWAVGDGASVLRYQP